MRTKRKLLYTMLLLGCCVFMLSGCSQEDDWASAPEQNVIMQINVGSRASGDLTAEELALHSFRVYAFVGGRPAGYYFNNSTNLSFPTTFLMDLKMFSNTTQEVDFYVIANEAAMSDLNVTLDENTTEAQLKSAQFTTLATANGLPMFYQETVSVNVAENTDQPSQAVNADEHEGHQILAQKLTFNLKRPMAKLGIFAAGVEGQTQDITITDVTLSHVATSNYLMPQASLSPTLSTAAQDLFDGSITLTKKLSPAATDTERQDETNYDEIVLPHYLFENPAGSTDWQTPDAENKGCRLEITYRTTGITGTKTGVVYLPAITRNNYYKVCCLINEGSITVNDFLVIVEPWNEKELPVPPFN